MSTDFELSLIDGQMRLVDSSDQRNLLPGTAPAEYPNVQAAVDRSLGIIAEATGRMSSDTVDDEKLKSGFDNGSIQLVLRGAERELNVAALHLHVRLGLDFDGLLQGKSQGLKLVPLPGAEDGYATYRFANDMRPLEAMRGLLERWLREAEREPQARARAIRNKERWTKLLALGGPGRAPVRVVVTGVTGAGKSTFLNGLLGRDIVPHSSGVCTAAVLRLRHAASPALEGVVVRWRSEGEIQAVIKRFEDEVQYLGSKRQKAAAIATSHFTEIGSNLDQMKQRLAVCEQKLVAFRNAREERRRDEKAKSGRRPLSALPRFARNDPWTCAELIQEIDVYVAHPLLERVEIVDAPGLRDGNDDRQKSLVRAFEGDTAWLYLVPAASRDHTCQEDWKHIESLANNKSGVLVLTKADGQPANTGSTLDQTLERRMNEDYSETYGWRRPMTWCTALLPSKLAAMNGAWSAAGLWNAVDESQLNSILGFKRTASRRLEDFLDGVPSAPLRRQTFSDYVADASRLPCAMRKVGTVLYEEAISQKVRQGREELTAVATEAVGTCDSALSDTQRILSAHDFVAAQKDQARQLEDRLPRLQSELDLAVARHAEIRSALQAQCEAAIVDFEARVDSSVNFLEPTFSAVFSAQTRDIYWAGARSFSIIKHLETPLSETGHGLLGTLAHVSSELVSPLVARSLTNKEIRPEQCLLAASGVTDIEDAEGFFELETTTRERMWKETQARAQKCAQQLKANFRNETQKVLHFAEAVMAEDKNNLESRRDSARQELDAIRRTIAENNPAQSLKEAGARLNAYTQHKAAFEKFLSALGADSRPGPRTTSRC